MSRSAARRVAGPIIPDVGELMTIGEHWQRYAARLAANPDAEFKE